MPTSSTPRILVIDDEPCVRDLYREAFEAMGYQVEAVASGTEGLARFAAVRHAVVVTDLAMPGWSGWQVIDRIRTLDPWTPVIVTGHATDDDVERANAHRIPVLEKPVTMKNLAQTIAAARTSGR